MSEQSSADRNLPASQRKLIKARAQGQVTRSRDLGHFVALATAGTLLVTASPWLAQWLQQLLMHSLSFDHSAVQSTAYMGEQLWSATLRLLMVLVPMFAIMMAAGMASNLAVGGWNWTLQPMMPQFGKLNPINGLPALFASAKLLDALKGCGLALTLGAIGGFYLKSHVPEFSAALSMPLQTGISYCASTMVSGLGLLLLAL